MKRYSIVTRKTQINTIMDLASRWWLVSLKTRCKASQLPMCCNYKKERSRQMMVYSAVEMPGYSSKTGKWKRPNLQCPDDSVLFGEQHKLYTMQKQRHQMNKNEISIDPRWCLLTIFYIQGWHRRRSLKGRLKHLGSHPDFFFHDRSPWASLLFPPYPTPWSFIP